MEFKASTEWEYARDHALVDAQPRAVDADFEKAVKALKKPAKSARQKKT